MIIVNIKSIIQAVGKKDCIIQHEENLRRKKWRNKRQSASKSLAKPTKPKTATTCPVRLQRTPSPQMATIWNSSKRSKRRRVSSLIPPSLATIAKIVLAKANPALEMTTWRAPLLTRLLKMPSLMVSAKDHSSAPRAKSKSTRLSRKTSKSLRMRTPRAATVAQTAAVGAHSASSTWSN